MPLKKAIPLSQRGSKKIPDSDSDSDSDSSSSETIYSTESDSNTSSIISSERGKKHKKNKHESNEEIDSILENTILEMFPSAYAKDKYKGKKDKHGKNGKSKKSESLSPLNKKKSKKEVVSDDEEPVKKSSKKRKVREESSKFKKNKKSKKIVESEDENSNSDESDSNSNNSTIDDSDNISIDSDDNNSDSDEETNSMDDDDDDEDDENAGSDEENQDETVADDAGDKNFKITLTIGGNELGLGRRSNPLLSQNTNDEYTSEDEKTFMRETYEDMDIGLPSTVSTQSLVALDAKSPKSKKSQKKEKAAPTFNDVDIEEKYKEIIELKKVLYEKYRKNPKNKIIKNAVEQCNLKIKKLIKNARNKNAEEFEMLLGQTEFSENTDELGYFKRKLSNKEQLKIMSDLRELNDKLYVDKPYRLTLLQSSLPPSMKAMVLQKVNQLSSMDPGDNEYYKLKNWVDSFMRIPFGKYKNISISIADGIDKCNEFVVNAKKQLDQCVYGLGDAKMQIMQMVGQWISNPKSLGTAIAVKGPPGTGKTSLIKDGVSKILGREFAFIALGGCGDSSFLEGHSYTYEGSTYGKIVQILMESKCMNPVIYFDELDKVSDTARGQEIISLLTHLTDTTQNSQFRDKYFSETEFDLSKCLFIFSYNDENLVNPILKDRMYRIQTQGYDLKEKQIIAKNYMLPKIREQVGFAEGDIIITDEVLAHIISNQAKGESGVRNLKRCLEIIHTKLNLYRLVKSGTELFDKEMGLKVTFPYTVTKKDVDSLIKVEDAMNQSVLYSLYV